MKRLRIWLFSLLVFIIPIQVSNISALENEKVDIIKNTMQENERCGNSIMQERYSIRENDMYEIKIELTYYTSLAICNGSNSGLTASGVPLNENTIAVPRKKGSTRPIVPFGTKIYIEGIGVKIAEDTGNPNYIKVKDDGTWIIDVYVPRNKGENDKEYHRRIMQMGRTQTEGIVYLGE